MISVNDLERLVVRLTMDMSGWDRGIRKLEKDTMKLVNNIGAFGRKMTMGLTAPLAAMGGFATREFAKFDDAMTKSLAIMDGVGGSTESLMGDLAKDLSMGSTKGPEELAKSYYYLASAGWDAQQSMKGLPTVLNFAEAGAFDMARATDLLTDAQTALGLSYKDPTRNMQGLVNVSDSLVLAAKQSNATVEQFSESITNDAGNAARGFGMELHTLMGVLDAYATKGKKGAEAGNLMGRATRLLTASYRKNTQVFEKFGIDVVDDATGRYNNFIDIIGDMERAFRGMTEPQRDAALEMLGFEALAQKSITPLLGMSDAMKQWEDQQKSASGITQTVADKQLKSFSAQMKMFWNQIKVVSIEIGERLAPGVLRLNNWIKGGLEWWDKLNDQQKNLTVGLGMVAAGIGPVLWGFSKLVTMFKVVPMLTGAFALLTNPVVLATGAVVGLTAAWVKFTKSGQDTFAAVKKWFSPLTEWVYGFAGDMKDGFSGIWLAIQNGQWGDAGKIAMHALGASFNDGMAKLMENWGSWINVMAESFVGGMDIVRKAWTKSIDWIGRQVLSFAGQDGLMGDMARDLLGGIDLRDDKVRGKYMKQQESSLRHMLKQYRLAKEGKGTLAYKNLDDDTIDSKIAGITAKLNSKDFGLDMATLMGGGSDVFNVMDDNFQRDMDRISGQTAKMMADWNEWSDPKHLRAQADQHRTMLDAMKLEQEELKRINDEAANSSDLLTQTTDALDQIDKMTEDPFMLDIKRAGSVDNAIVGTLGNLLSIEDYLGRVNNMTLDPPEVKGVPIGPQEIQGMDMVDAAIGETMATVGIDHDIDQLGSPAKDNSKVLETLEQIALNTDTMANNEDDLKLEVGVIDSLSF